MPTKLFDSELKVMEALWEGGDLTAGQLAKILNEQTGWNRNTTYTVIKKLIAKGAVDRLFDGSAELFLSAYASGKGLSSEEIDGLRRLVERLK